MTRPWGSADKWVYAFLVQRDGQRCKVCGKGGVELVRDHIDHDPRNNDPANLRLLCRSCNRISTQVMSESVCEKKDSNADVDATENAHSHIDYSSGSLEMQASELFETAFRRWVYAKLTFIGRPVLKKEIIAGGAEEIGCSVATTTRYLAKMTSAEGLLKEVKTSNGKAVWWRNEPVHATIELIAEESR